jgi:hypothetical protein
VEAAGKPVVMDGVEAGDVVVDVMHIERDQLPVQDVPLGSGQGE